MARPGPKGVSFAEFRTIDAVDPIAVALQRACGPETLTLVLISQVADFTAPTYLDIRQIVSKRFKSFQTFQMSRRYRAKSRDGTALLKIQPWPPSRKRTAGPGPSHRPSILSNRRYAHPRRPAGKGVDISSPLAWFVRSTLMSRCGSADTSSRRTGNSCSSTPVAKPSPVPIEPVVVRGIGLVQARLAGAIHKVQIGLPVVVIVENGDAAGHGLDLVFSGRG